MTATRADQIAALYELALLLEQNPEIPVPFELSHGLSIHFFNGTDDRAELLKVARLLPGDGKKRVYGGNHGGAAYFELTYTVGTIPIALSAYRDQVCERVVTGTREVTKTVPDPSVDVPLVEVTETVEDVEWVCGPVLAGSKPAVDVQSAYSARLNELEPDGIPVAHAQVDLAAALRDAVDRAKAARS